MQDIEKSLTKNGRLLSQNVFLLLLIKSSINQKYQTVVDDLSYCLISPEASKFEWQHSVHLLLYDLEKNEYLNIGVNKLGDWSSKFSLLLLLTHGPEVLQINTAPLLCVAGIQI